MPRGEFKPVTTSVAVGVVALMSILEILFPINSDTYRSVPLSSILVGPLKPNIVNYKK